MNRIINECADSTRLLVAKHAKDIENLAEELLQKETLDLMDIIRILGERPFPLSDSMKDYMKEIEMRKEEHKKKLDKEREEKEKKELDEKNKDDKEDKDEKDDKDGKEGEDDKKPKPKPKPVGPESKPEDKAEQTIKEAETAMKIK